MADFLEINNVSRHFGGHKAVEGVTFGVPQASVTGLIGPNGAGKTTLFNLISGNLAPTAGTIHFQGKTVTNACGACIMGIGRTFQNVRLFHEMSVLENVLTGMGGGGFLEGSFRFLKGVEAERLRMKRAFYLLGDVGVSHLAEQQAGEIPFGQQRLVEIARALAPQPKLLLLDEPAAGLNRTETLALRSLIQRIHQRGITILLVEHDMHLVMNLVERVIVLDQGRKIAEGTPAQVQADTGVCTAYLGNAS